MSCLSRQRLATLALCTGIATLFLSPYTGVAANAQTSDNPDEAEVETDPTDGENDAADGEIESDETAEDTTTADSPRFTCQMHNGRYTVMYTPESQPNQPQPWAIPGDMGSNWPAQRRCSEIGARLESYRPDGLLELQTGVENGYNTVCVTTESNPTCRIVFTVPDGQDPIATRNQVFENLTLADSGQQTQGVNTFAGGENDVLQQIEDILGTSTTPATPTLGSRGINLKPFLAPEDGGTGTQLSNDAAGSRTLDPDNFR